MLCQRRVVCMVCSRANKSKYTKLNLGEARSLLACGIAVVVALAPGALND